MSNQQANPIITGLTAQAYDQQYYEEHASAGLDYLGHGYWQESYAQMVVEATLQAQYEAPFICDAGCACGSILFGFKKTGVFRTVLGIDLSNYMVGLGRKHFQFSDGELVAGSITDVPIPRNTVTCCIQPRS
jgi:2-polyprenyl-3-methyl-5-hydroxy-6-metoxy-1,4-benzoquinol methylase